VIPDGPTQTLTHTKRRPGKRVQPVRRLFARGSTRGYHLKPKLIAKKWVFTKKYKTEEIFENFNKVPRWAPQKILKKKL